MLLNLNAIFDPDRPPGQRALTQPEQPTADGAVPGAPAELPIEWHFAWDERAAIMEFDGNLPRERAEALALADILALKSNVKSPARDIQGGQPSPRSL